MADIQPKYFDLKSLSKYSCISVGSLRDYIKSGDLPAAMPKGKLLVKRSVFDKWVDDHPFKPDQDIDSIADEVMDSLKAGVSNQ